VWEFVCDSVYVCVFECFYLCVRKRVCQIYVCYCVCD